LTKKNALSNAFQWLNIFFEKQQVFRNTAVCFFPTSRRSSPNTDRKLSPSSVAIRSQLIPSRLRSFCAVFISLKNGKSLFQNHALFFYEAMRALDRAAPL
jgi:hypothetical protein